MPKSVSESIERSVAETTPDRQRLVLPERAADRGHRVADLDVGLRAERERVQVEAVGIDLEQRDVGERVEADDVGA